MLVIIDADILVYEAAYRAQTAEEWSENEFTYTANLVDAQADFDASIKEIGQAVGATDMILCLTDSDRDANFRRHIFDPYKRSRGKAGNARPLVYKALRAWIRETYNVKQKHGIEADDTIGILATADLPSLPPKSHRVMASVDKDLDTVPGLHYNWRKPEDGVYSVGRNEAFYNLMIQTLCGDSTDNYPGLKGVGPKTAEKILTLDEEKRRAGTADELLLQFEVEMWEAVVDAYEKKGQTLEDALVQARCARILQAEDWDFENEEVILWTPPEMHNAHYPAD